MSDMVRNANCLFSDSKAYLRRATFLTSLDDIIKILRYKWHFSILTGCDILYDHYKFVLGII